MKIDSDFAGILDVREADELEKLRLASTLAESLICLAAPE